MTWTLRGPQQFPPEPRSRALQIPFALLRPLSRSGAFFFPAMLKLDNGINVSIEDNTDGLIIQKTQTVSDGFLRDLADKRLASHNVREADYMHVASIPVCIVDKWMKEGYDVFREPIRKSVAKLKHENLEYFLATAKDL